MGTWSIYSKNGTVKCAASNLEFHDTWMGEEFVTVTITSPTPIDLEVGDYLTYRGATYTIYSLPTALKSARRNTYGEAFKYDGVKLSARSTELTDIRFLDIVLNDNNLHYTSLPTFSVYCQTVDDLVDRLQANTDRNGIQWFFITPNYSRTMQRYTGTAAVTAQALWEQYYGTTHQDTDAGTKEVNISVDKMSVWDGLAFIKNNFGLNFITRDRTCVIGSPGVIADHIFRYGKGQGLYEIERTADQDQQIVTKLFAYGSDKNLPLRYYATISDDMPNNMAVNVLMLPGFPQYSLSQLCRTTYYTDGTGAKHTKVQIRKTPSASYADIMDILGEYTIGFSDNKLRPYITSGNVDALGVKEGDIHFTEENDDNGLQEVYPSIEGMTAGDAGVSGLPADERLDEIVSISNLDGTKAYIDDNGVFEEGATIPNFCIYLKPLGFNLKEAYDANGGTMVIHVNDGYCGGRDFAVKGVTAHGTGWKLNVERHLDESLDLYFPYSWAAATGGTPSANEAYQIRTGDHFVLTEIEISDTSYIWAASVKALRKAITWLLNNDYTRFTYLPKVDEIFMARQHDSAQGSQSIVSLHDTLKAGDVMTFEDTDLNISGNVFIDSLTIKENGNNGIPTYDVVLRNDKQVGTMQRIQNQLNTLSSFVAGGGGGLSIQQIRQLIQAYGSDLFLSKLNNDTAQGFIRFMQGLQVGNQFVSGILGEGGVFRKDADGKTYIEADKMYVRMKAYFDSVEIREYQHTSGNRIASQAKGFTASRVEWLDASGNVTDNINNVVKFRCYWRAKDDEHETQNQFVVGDQAFMEYSDIVDGNLVQKRFWRVVVGRNVSLTEDGEAWIDLSNLANDTITYIDHQGTSRTKSVTGFEPNSSIPQPEDDICQLGNVWDTERQGAIIEYVSGGDAPSYQIFQGIDSFSLNGKNMVGLGYSSLTGKAYMNVYGDAYIGDPQGSTYVKYEQRNSATLAPKLTIKAVIEASSPIADGQTVYNDMQSFIEAHSSDWTQQQINTLIHTVTDPMQAEIDGAIETWYMTGVPTLNNLPASQWTTDDEKDKHLGDLYYDKATGHGYRFMYDDEDDVYMWVILTDEDVTEALRIANQAQDTADGKRTIYVTWNAWMKNNVNTLEVGDLFIPAQNTTPTGTTTTYYKGKVYKCTTEGTNAFEEINYTDDSKFDGYINAILNGTGSSGDAAVAAAAQKAIKDALGGGTIVDGGLLLTSLIAMRKKNQDNTYTTWAGISGMYQDNVLGGGLAAWYGGNMIDKETLTAQQIEQGWSTVRWAKSVDRFDGSGYRADGNITWNANGALTIKNITTLSDSNNNNILNELATFNSAFTFATSGQGSTTALYINPNVPFSELYIGTSSANKKEVATKEWANSQFLTTSFFDELFQLYNNTTKISPNGTIPTDKTNLNIKAMFGFWTEKYISALGKNTSGGGGGGSDIDMTTVWSAMANNTNEQINLSHLTTALSGYATQSWVYQQLTGGTVTAVKVGNTSYSPTDGVVSLPAYPSTLDDIADGSTRKLANYLPLSGGTLTGLLTVSSTGSNRATIHLVSAADVPNDLYFGSHGVRHWSLTSRSSGEGHIFYLYNNINPNDTLVFYNDNRAVFANSVTASSFIKSDGTSSQFLKADGSVDSNSYATQTWVGQNYLPLSGGTITDSIIVSNDFKCIKTSYFGEQRSTSAFINVVTIANDSYESQVSNSSTNYSTSISSYGIGFDRLWNGYNSSSSAGIYAYGTGGWGTGLVFRVKSTNSGAGTHHNITALDLRGDGVVVAPQGILGNSSTATKLETARTLWGQSFDGSGNVDGVITATANFSGYNPMLTLEKTSNQYSLIHIKNTVDNLQLGIQSDGIGLIYMTGEHPVDLCTNSATRVRITSSGNVGIGTTSPSCNLEVIGTTRSSHRLTVGYDAGDWDASRAEFELISAGNNANDFWMGSNSARKWGISCRSTSENSTLNYYNSSVQLRFQMSQNGDFYAYGTIHAVTGIYSDGYVSALGQNTSSDARKKDIKESVELPVESIANAPSVRYEWKDNRHLGMQVGSIAQYWQTVLPESVHKDNKGYLSMEYGVIALLASISTARKVQDHERRIKELEKENERLRTEVEQLRLS